MPVLYANNAATTLASSITNSATSLTVVSGTGALFPSITNGNYFYATIENNAGAREIVKVTAISTDTLTIVRAQDGSSAAAWSAGDRVELRICKAMLDQLKADAIASYTAADVLAKLLTVDGTGSGLDADLFDGQHGSYYQPVSTAITTSNIGSQSVNYAASAGTAAGLSATLATTSGGTGLTSFTSGGVVYASSTSALTTGSGLVFDGSNFIVNPTNTQFYVGSSFAKITNTSGSGASFIMQDTSNSATIKNIGSAIAFINSSSEGMRLDASGKLGLGTASPAVIGSGYGVFDNRGANGAGQYFGNSTDFGQLYADSTATYLGSATAKPLVFQTGGTEKMRIDSSGNLGIGCSPSTKLHVYGSSSTASNNSIRLDYSSNTLFSVGSYGSGAYLSRAYMSMLADGVEKIALNTAGDSYFLGGNLLVGGTSGSQKLTVVGNLKSAGAQASNVSKAIFTRTDVSWSINNETDLRFFMGAGDTDSPGTLVAAMTSSGNLLVGTTTVLDGGSYRLQIKHDGERGIITNATGTTTNYPMIFQNGNGTVGSISTSGSSTSYATSSDYRLKEDIQSVATPIDRLNELKPINFAWKVDGSRCDGFLAHELQEVIPEAATGIKDEVDADGNPVYQGIDQSKIVPLLTAALQEAVARIESLTERIAALENKGE